MLSSESSMFYDYYQGFLVLAKIYAYLGVITTSSSSNRLHYALLLRISEGLAIGSIIFNFEGLPRVLTGETI